MITIPATLALEHVDEPQVEGDTEAEQDGDGCADGSGNLADGNVSLTRRRRAGTTRRLRRARFEQPCNAPQQCVTRAVPSADQHLSERQNHGEEEERREGRKGRRLPSRLIDAQIKKLKDWRGETLARVRKLIKEADPVVVEQVKWKKPSNGMLGVPVWEHDGIICTGETYKNAVKLTFAKGAALEDPTGLFNSSLEGNTRRAIDIHEGDKIDEKALKALIRAAVALNTSVQS